MPTPPSSSSAWQARQALGARLGELRQDAGLTGRALAQLCGWHESKVSRIEHARTAPAPGWRRRTWAGAPRVTTGRRRRAAPCSSSAIPAPVRSTPWLTSRRGPGWRSGMSATSELGAVRPAGLSDAGLRGFLARARQLGHDTGRLLAGEPVSSRVRLPGIDDIRRLCLVGPAERLARQAGFFHPAMAARSRLGQGVHDRCEAYAFADGHVDDADRARLAIHLPFPARFVSILSRRVAAGEVWDLTVAPAELGVDERDDVLNVVNLGELLIEPGGRVIVQGNLLIFGCQHLRHQAPAGDAGYQLGVLPTPYPVDRRSGPRNGRAGPPGAAGADRESAGSGKS